jgi:glycosyltransferase involved in cell wall biosynthesis
MKILRIIVSLNPGGGGPAQGIRNSIPAMAKQGVENEVVCFDSPDAEFLKQDNFPVHALGFRCHSRERGNPLVKILRRSWSYNPKLYSWLLENLGNYDAVIVHGLWLYHGYAAFNAWKKYKKTHTTYPKLFVMPHGMLDPYFQQAKERLLKAVRNYFYWKLIESKVINGADGILFTCKEELRLARRPFKPYKPKQELNVSYGIQPPPVFNEKMTAVFREKVPQWNGKPFILFLSRIHEKKGVDLLIRAYRRVIAGFDPQSPVTGDCGFRRNDGAELPQLIIAGPLDSNYAQEMQNLAKDNENIIFAGMLRGDAKWGAFYSCECFILPSHQENFGIAIVEAMACHKPVLITDKINIWREISSENAGFVFGDNKEETFINLKKFLTLQAEEKTAMVKNAFAVYQKYFSIEKSAEKFLNVIK